ncbi:MAG TPA: alpha/beta fold hydrolase [Candidatus Hydrogenedentes bacterium]|nr:alpha/beta fold hydrolase [Candidatus Hydrogenedentota bacterium]
MVWFCILGGLLAADADLSTHNAKNVPLSEIKTPAEWDKYCAGLRARMEEVMGPMPGPDRNVPLDMRVEEEIDTPKYVQRKITFAVEDWDRVPAYLLMPKERKGKTPAMVCLHPTSEHGKKVVVGLAGAVHRSYAKELAERGYITIAPDYPGFGEYISSRKALYEHGYVSCTMKGIWNHMRVVDLLQSLPEVDPARIGCIGHSLGGHNTLFLGVFDPRVKVLVSSCGFTAFHKYYAGDLTGWTHDGYMPRIASVYEKNPDRMPFDFPEIIAALAPRAVFVNAPLHDANFDVSGVRECISSAQPVYKLFGAEAKLAAQFPDAEHDFPDMVRNAAYVFIDTEFH